MDRSTRFFLFLLTLHSALLLTSTIAGAKIFALPFGMVASATVISYMLTFIVINAIGELFGRSYGKFVINLGFVSMVVSAVYCQFAIWLPPAEVWSHQPEFEIVLGSTWRIWLGGWLGYLLSQHFDLWTFLTLRKFNLGRASIAVRAWVSLVFGQLFDTALFIGVAFYGTIPLADAIFGQYLVKLILSTVTAPLVYVVILIGRRYIRGRDGVAPVETII